jgi:hypothetical protein
MKPIMEGFWKFQRLQISLPLLALFLCAGCASIVQSTDHPDFLAVKDGRFVLLVDGYVYEDLEQPKRLRAYPQVGFPPRTPGVRGLSYFPERPQDWIGKERNRVRFLAVIPAGTTFTVAQHRIENHPTMGPLHHFDIAPEGLLAQRWPLLDGFWLTQTMTDRIRFRPEIVARKE